MEEQAACPFCGVWELGVAFERANLPDSALAAYERLADSAGIYTKAFEAPVRQAGEHIAALSGEPH